MQTKRQYSEDFKKETTRLLETSGIKLSDIKRELGVPHG